MDPLLLRFATVLGLMLLATAAGRVWQHRDGRVTLLAVPTAATTRSMLGLPVAHRGPQAVLFGSDTCAPCETVKTILRDVETDRSDFRWSYVDAAQHLDLAREHGVMRVPTLLVLDEDGTVIARSSGVPKRGDLDAALTPTRRAVA